MTKIQLQKNFLEVITINELKYLAIGQIFYNYFKNRNNPNPPK